MEITTDQRLSEKCIGSFQIPLNLVSKLSYKPDGTACYIVDPFLLNSALQQAGLNQKLVECRENTERSSCESRSAVIAVADEQSMLSREEDGAQRLAVKDVVSNRSNASVNICQKFSNVPPSGVTERYLNGEITFSQLQTSLGLESYESDCDVDIEQELTVCDIGNVEVSTSREDSITNVVDAVVETIHNPRMSKLRHGQRQKPVPLSYNCTSAVRHTSATNSLMSKKAFLKQQYGTETTAKLVQSIEATLVAVCGPGTSRELDGACSSDASVGQTEIEDVIQDDSMDDAFRDHESDEDYVPTESKKRRKLVGSKVRQARKAQKSMGEGDTNKVPSNKARILRDEFAALDDAYSDDNAAGSARASGTWRKALPDELQSLLGQANLNFALGKHEEAISMCEEVIKQKPRHADPYQVLARYYDEIGDRDKHLQCSLLAVHLSGARVSCEEWVRLAELSVSKGDCSQAIACYSKAIKVNPSDWSLYERKIALLEQMGPKAKKRLVATYVDASKGLQSAMDFEAYTKLARRAAQMCMEDEELSGGIVCISCLLERGLVEDVLQHEELHMYVELLMHEKKYMETLKSILKFGRIFPYAGDLPLKIDDIFLPLDGSTLRYEWESHFPVDLQAKFCVCAIHLHRLDVAQPIVEMFQRECSCETEGDLYFELAEALAERGYTAEAMVFLQHLIQSEEFDKAAVWLRYAEVLQVLGSLEQALVAFQRVVDLAPHHVGARLSLAAIHQQLGRTQQALEALEPAGKERACADERSEFYGMNERVLYQKSLVLFAHNELAKFKDAALQLLAPYLAEVYMIGNDDARWRPKLTNAFKLAEDARKAIVDGFRHTTVDSLVRQFTPHDQPELRADDVADVFWKLADVLFRERNFVDLAACAALSLVCPQFAESTFASRLLAVALFASVQARVHNVTWALLRSMCAEADAELPHNTRLWNLYGLLFTRMQEVRFHRFTLRTVLRLPDCKPLSLANANNSLVTGTYQHALAEYLTLYQEDNNDPLVALLVGAAFAHIASKKSVARRHDICMESFAFLSKYELLRGPCHEVFFNLGRLLQQLGLLYLAAQFYEKVLSAEPSCTACSRDGEAVADGCLNNLFDLRPLAAYNLALMYRNSGNVDLARLVLQKHCVI